MALLACKARVIAVDWHEFIFFDWEDEWAEDECNLGGVGCAYLRIQVSEVQFGV